MAFGLAGGESRPPSAEPVRTYVSLTADVSDDVARKIVDMGERTCFLHAASRTPLKSRVRVTDVTRNSAEEVAAGASAAAG
jgi:hypothetical protein